MNYASSIIVFCALTCQTLIGAGDVYAESCQERARRIIASAPNSDYQCFENGARLFIVKWSRGAPSEEFFIRTGETLGGFSDVPAPIIESMARSCHDVALRSGEYRLPGVKFTLTCRIRGAATSVAIIVDAP